MLSQEIIYDENLNSLSIEAYYVFTRLLVVSDDFGFVPANEYTICALINPNPKIKKNIKKYISEIVENNIGFIFVYGDKEYFSFKKGSFDTFQSYVIAKRTKSEYLKLSKEEIESENFQEFLGNYRKVISDDIISIKNKVISNKHKVESNKHKDRESRIYEHPLQEFVANLANVSNLENQLTKEECLRLVGEYDDVMIKDILQAMENKKDLTKKYKSVNLTLRNWIKIRLEGNDGTGTNRKPYRKGDPDPNKYGRELATEKRRD